MTEESAVLRDRAGLVYEHYLGAAKAAALEGKSQIEIHEGDMIEHFQLSGAEASDVLSRFRRSGFGVSSENRDAGAPPMGWPEDDATITVHTIRWNEELKQ